VPKPPTYDFASHSVAQLLSRGGTYLGRAIRLRCPECGVSPVFPPLRRTRSWRDWVTPLDGCPRCGYAYEREDGYFLLAIWGVHYFTVTGVGLTTALLVDHFFPGIPLPALVAGSATFTVALAALFIRHAKSIYVAVDHYFDPHVRPEEPPPPAV
jgi:uncharacterized protein (DUF983 family)